MCKSGWESLKLAIYNRWSLWQVWPYNYYIYRYYLSHTSLFSDNPQIFSNNQQYNHWPGDPHLANYHMNESDFRPSDQYTLSSLQNTMSSVPPDVTLHAQDFQGSREYLASSNYTSSDLATTSNDYSSLYTGSRDYQSSTVPSSNDYESIKDYQPSKKPGAIRMGVFSR